MDRSTLRRFSPHLVAVGALIALGLVSGLLWMERRNRFPVLEPGTYAGKIVGLFPGEGDATVPFFVEQVQGRDILLISLVRENWEPRLLAGLNAEGSTTSIMPVLLEGPGATLRFIGSRAEGRHYSGTVKDADGTMEGRWELDGIVKKDDQIQPPIQEQLKLWLKLKEELANTEAHIHEAQARIPEDKKEIDKLSAFLNEGEKVKSSADEKFAEVQKELEKVQLELKQRQARAKILEDKLELSQQVTGMGRLVQLGRQSLDREGRWIESILRTGHVTSSPEVDASVAEGEKILALKEQIERERSRINELTPVGGAHE